MSCDMANKNEVVTVHKAVLLRAWYIHAPKHNISRRLTRLSTSYVTNQYRFAMAASLFDGHGEGVHFPMPSVCCTMVGTGPPDAGQRAWPLPSM